MHLTQRMALKDIKKNLSDSVKYIFLNQYVLRPLAKYIKENLNDEIKVILLITWFGKCGLSA